MSITFFANIDIDSFKKKKVFVEDSYELDSFEYSDHFESDPFLIKDFNNGRFYEMVPDIDFVFEINMANDNFYSVIKNIDNELYLKTLENHGCGKFDLDELPELSRKIIKAINNSSQNGTREEINEANFFVSSIDKEYIKSRLNTILLIIGNAQKNNVGVSFG